MLRTDARVWISTPADTLSTEVSSVLGILIEYRHRYLKAFSHVLRILWYHIILILQYDYLKLVYSLNVLCLYMLYDVVSEIKQLITKKKKKKKSYSKMRKLILASIV